MKQKSYSTLRQMPLGQPLFQAIQSNLAGFEFQRNNAPGTQRAAVAVTLVEVAYGSGINGMTAHKNWNRAAALILTRRNAGLKNHSGQWAFPGGRQEHGESLEHTALRELNEEVGLALDPSGFWGGWTISRPGPALPSRHLWSGVAQMFSSHPTPKKLRRSIGSRYQNFYAPMRLFCIKFLTATNRSCLCR